VTVDIAAALARSGVSIPAGHRLVSLAEDPTLADAMSAHNGAVWPAFMLKSANPADPLWPHLDGSFAEFQAVLLDGADRIVAALNSAPIRWDGTIDGLPDGWDEQFQRSVEQHESGLAPNTLGALQIVVAPDAQGGRLSGLMVQAMLASARTHGFRSLIACVRPTLLERYPLVPIERYVSWMHADGLPFDPWIRLHVRLGGRVVRPSPRSMAFRAPVVDWERWTGMAFPESGAYVVPRAAALVEIDREADEGVYFDPNVWVIHEV
jgi:hypothetical protein